MQKNKNTPWVFSVPNNKQLLIRNRLYFSPADQRGVFLKVG